MKVAKNYSCLEEYRCLKGSRNILSSGSDIIRENCSMCSFIFALHFHGQSFKST